MWLRRVVLPAPRKPVRTVTGTRPAVAVCVIRFLLRMRTWESTPESVRLRSVDFHVSIDTGGPGSRAVVSGKGPRAAQRGKQARKRVSGGVKRPGGGNASPPRAAHVSSAG